MGEAFWAAREGDALLHTSFLADLVGSALEFAINAVIDFCGTGCCGAGDGGYGGNAGMQRRITCGDRGRRDDVTEWQPGRKSVKPVKT
ncbi:hypothetical protein LFZ31_13500 [Salmonella enterica subsp. enterica serovar Newport str. S09097]|nr:hypothetical protein LFZ31_13500 [Salmonella enterica subsp. enterica serovar Newport str. S09097]